MSSLEKIDIAATTNNNNNSSNNIEPNTAPAPASPAALAATAALTAATAAAVTASAEKTVSSSTSAPVPVPTAPAASTVAVDSDKTATIAKEGDEEKKKPTEAVKSTTDTETAPTATAEAAAAAPSTPSKVVSISKENSQPDQAKSQKETKQPQPRIGRRSTRILEQDPIIAPGYGTRKDLLRLTAQLNQNNNNSTTGTTTTELLPYEAIEAMMQSRGRGIRSSSRRGKADDDGDNSGAAAATASTAGAAAASSAWADFMNEEGFGGGGGAASSSKEEAKAEESSSTSSSSARKRSARGATAAATEQDNYFDYNDPNNTNRVYVLPTEWQEFEAATAGGKGKKSKKSSSSTTGGILVQAGTLDSTIVGRKSIGGASKSSGGGGKKKGSAAAAAAPPADCPYHLMSPTRLVIGSSMIQIEKVFTSCNSVHSIALANGGMDVYGWGRNEAQQLTANLASSSVPWPTLLTEYLPDEVQGVGVASAATGKSHTVLLTNDGSAYAVGANKSGQCAVKSSVEQIAQFKKVVIDDNADDTVTLVQVSCGEDFTMAVDSSGYLYSAGSSQYGQLGNGETGEYFVTANKLAFANCHVLKRRSNFCQEDAKAASSMASSRSSNNKDQVVPIVEDKDILIQQVVCGKHHTVAVEASCSNKALKPRVFTWGCGDYGCLGHGVQKDEYYPRLLDSINQMAQIQGNTFTAAAGAHCSLLLTPNGHVYYWGKHRSVGEATMRPQLVDVLANNQHVVTHCAAGGATVVCSTSLAQTVAWGQGPHGELGFGTAKKSSAKPDFVQALHGCRVLEMACGYGHSVYVVSNQDAEDREALGKLDEVEEDDVQDLVDAAQAKQEADEDEDMETKPTKKKGKKRGSK